MPHPEVPEGPGDDGRPSDGRPSPLRRSEIRLIEQAARSRWPIDPSVRMGTIRGLVRALNEALPDDEPRTIIDDDGNEVTLPPLPANARVVVAVSRALIAMDALNLMAEKLDDARAARQADSGSEATAADVIRQAEQLALEHRPCPDPPSS